MASTDADNNTSVQSQLKEEVHDRAFIVATEVKSRNPINILAISM